LPSQDREDGVTCYGLTLRMVGPRSMCNRARSRAWVCARPRPTQRPLPRDRAPAAPSPVFILPKAPGAPAADSQVLDPSLTSAARKRLHLLARARGLDRGPFLPGGGAGATIGLPCS